MYKKPIWVILTTLIALAFIIGACAPAAPEPTPLPPDDDDDMPYAGETVTIFTAAGEEQLRVFEQNFVEFQERTGINVVVEGSPDFETLAVVRAEAGDPHDILNFPQPGLMADMARDGYLVDLGQFISDQEMQTFYAQSWIDLGTVDGTLVGVWHGADVKSLVWYPKPAFEAAGYSIPQTWDELIALSEQILADGTAPWCIGIESGGATGWPGTDWIEDIMLRTTSPENYDRWTTGDLPFNSPEVRNAFEIMADIWFRDGFVLGGTTGILSTNFGDAPLPMFDDPPSCFLHRQASFIPHFFPEGTQVGVDVDYFYLPPIDLQYGSPVLISGNLVSLANDTPAGREVMRFMITGESVRAEVEAGLVIGPHEDASLDWYPDDITRGFAEILMGADTVRFDGSDLMPGVVGAGSFWDGIVDFVAGEDLDTVLNRIDASWPGR
jgi:alpha-glucoside transport system substrate-binding protein